MDRANVLCSKGYLKGGDIIKMLNAPGTSFTAGVTTTASFRLAKQWYRDIRSESAGLFKLGSNDSRRLLHDLHRYTLLHRHSGLGSIPVPPVRW